MNAPFPVSGLACIFLFRRIFKFGKITHLMIFLDLKIIFSIESRHVQKTGEDT